MTTRLAEFTTFRVGGAAARLVVADDTDAVIDAVSGADAADEPLLVLGGGSNLLVGDDGFDGVVVHIATQGVEVESSDLCSGASVRVAAGQVWDSFVELAVGNGWTGIEALSGIPGSVGATPVQNVGAYGQEVAETIASVRTWDRQLNRVSTLAAADCEFGYRTSRLKQERFRGGPRYVVLEVTFQLPLGELSTPVRYAELARILGVEVGAAGPVGRRPRRRPGSASGQGHGAGRRRPRHLECRLVLHQPDPGGGGLLTGCRSRRPGGRWPRSRTG